MRKSVQLLWAVALLAAPTVQAIAQEAPASLPANTTTQGPVAAENPQPTPPAVEATNPTPPPANTTNPAPAGEQSSSPPVIGTQQIDRFEAINQLQQQLKSNPKSEADWVILGELAQEVADDLPADEAAKYYQMSRDAYEKALALDPDNPGLKAAVKFARDREANPERFSNARNQATRTYLEARRRDLAATGYTPAVRTYAPPVFRRPMSARSPASPATVVTEMPADTSERTTSDAAATTVSPAIVTTTAPTAAPAATTAPAGTTVPVEPVGPTAVTAPGSVVVPGEETPTTLAPTPHPAVAPRALESATSPVTSTQPASAPVGEETVVNGPFGVRQVYSAPIYQPYYSAQGTPYTYNQYTSGYYPENYYTTPGALPITTQRYNQMVPNALLNPVERDLLRGAPATAPAVRP